MPLTRETASRPCNAHPGRHPTVPFIPGVTNLPVSDRFRARMSIHGVLNSPLDALAGLLAGTPS